MSWGSPVQLIHGVYSNSWRQNDTRSLTGIVYTQLCVQMFRELKQKHCPQADYISVSYPTLRGEEGVKGGRRRRRVKELREVKDFAVILPCTTVTRQGERHVPMRMCWPPCCSTSCVYPHSTAVNISTQSKLVITTTTITTLVCKIITQN